MRVLWFINDPVPAFAEWLGISRHPGVGWVTTLADALMLSGKVNLCIFCYANGNTLIHTTIDNVEHYAIPAMPSRHGRFILNESTINAARYIENTFRPDIIHIHGTEYNMGLLSAQNIFSTPTVIPLQGIIDICQHYLFGGISIWNILKYRTFRDWITG